MKVRPQIQLRFRDEEQWERAKKMAEKAEVSLNEYVVLAIERKMHDDLYGKSKLSEVPEKVRFSE